MSFLKGSTFRILSRLLIQNPDPTLSCIGIVFYRGTVLCWGPRKASYFRELPVWVVWAGSGLGFRMWCLQDLVPRLRVCIGPDPIAWFDIRYCKLCLGFEGTSIVPKS